MARRFRRADVNDWDGPLLRYVHPEAISGCWLWHGTVVNGGYGHVSVAGKKTLAHRAMYEATREPIPEGMLVRHRCDVPACVNPDHLVLGSQADNMRDARARGRLRSSATKLTEASVREIRSRYAAGESQRALARAFGITKQGIQKIVHRRNWKDVA